mmetsp:Transcript_90460/g.194000  ORF Transcript_90460/g.194000 Transcript_90460/m.194000 type:complete len:223 (-) Transcript_90460:1547-2215(-)
MRAIFVTFSASRFSSGARLSATSATRRVLFTSARGQEGSDCEVVFPASMLVFWACTASEARVRASRARSPDHLAKPSTSLSAWLKYTCPAFWARARACACTVASALRSAFRTSPKARAEVSEATWWPGPPSNASSCSRKPSLDAASSSRLVCIGMIRAPLASSAVFALTIRSAAPSKFAMKLSTIESKSAKPTLTTMVGSSWKTLPFHFCHPPNSASTGIKP